MMAKLGKFYFAFNIHLPLQNYYKFLLKQLSKHYEKLTSAALVNKNGWLQHFFKSIMMFSSEELFGPPLEFNPSKFLASTYLRCTRSVALCLPKFDLDLQLHKIKFTLRFALSRFQLHNFRKTLLYQNNSTKI